MFIFVSPSLQNPVKKCEMSHLPRILVYEIQILYVLSSFPPMLLQLEIEFKYSSVLQLLNLNITTVRYNVPTITD